MVKTRSIFSEFVWLNDRFKWQKKVIFYRNWAKAGFKYVKDFFTDEGTFIDEISCFNRLEGQRRNWISEYMIIRTVIKKGLGNIHYTDAKYANIKHSTSFLFGHTFVDIKDKKSKFYYNVLLNNKFLRHYTEKNVE